MNLDLNIVLAIIIAVFGWVFFSRGSASALMKEFLKRAGLLRDFREKNISEEDLIKSPKLV